MISTRDPAHRADAEITSQSTFSGNDNYGKPRLNYVRRLETMTDDELKDEGEQKIWLSAFASNNRRSDYHWQVTAISVEMYIRDRSGQMYIDAFNAAKAA